MEAAVTFLRRRRGGACIGEDEQMKVNMKVTMISALVLVLAAFAGTADASYRYRDSYSNDSYNYSYNHVVRCDSRDGRTSYCRLDTRGGVRIIEQYSDSACVRGRSWGVDRDAVWVSRGCRARFAAISDYRYGRNDRYDDRYNDRHDNRYDDRYDDRYDNRYGG